MSLHIRYIAAGLIRRVLYQLPEYRYFIWIYTESDLVDLHIRLRLYSTATGVTFMKKWLLFSDFCVLFIAKYVCF